MILVAHQPEYIPYLGFFAKVSLCDVLLISDHLQYADKDFQNRNYVRGQNGKTLLTIPVFLAGKWDQRINEINIDNHYKWGRKHWLTIYHAYHKAPYFGLYAPALERIYATPWEKLAELNIVLLMALLKWLSIDVRVQRTSEYNLECGKTELLIEMCQKIGADTFISGRGARDYVVPAMFPERGLKHLFFDFVHPTYKQHRTPFVPDLSVLDLLFNVGPECRDVINDTVKLSSLSEF